jgi:hypothetical protein
MEFKEGFWKFVLITGIIAGLADIMGATISFMMSGGSNPVRILQYIASGVYGKAAFDGGTGMAILGFLFHMFNAMAFTLFFFIIYPTLRKISENPYVWIVVYGAAVWTVMNKIVVPLSNVTRLGTPTLRGMAIQMGILIICIGIPVVIGARRLYHPAVK